MFSSFRDKLRSVAEVIIYAYYYIHTFFVSTLIFFSVGNLERYTENDENKCYF